MAHHLLLDVDVVVYLAVVHLEPEPHEAGQDRGGARLRPDRRGPLSGLGADDRETARVLAGNLPPLFRRLLLRLPGVRVGTYGTMLGPVEDR